MECIKLIIILFLEMKLKEGNFINGKKWKNYEVEKK